MERLINIHEIFRFLGYSTSTNRILKHTLNTDTLSPPKKERIQEMEKVLQKWVYEIHLKHGFANSTFISNVRWKTYIHFLHSGQNPNTLWNDDMFLFIMWEGKTKDFDKLVSQDRKEAMYYRILNVHGKTKEELDQLMSTSTFLIFIHNELQKTRVESASPELCGLTNLICPNASGCDACVKNGVGIANYINQELTNLK